MLKVTKRCGLQTKQPIAEKRQGTLPAFTKSIGKNNEFSQLQKKKKKKSKDSLSFM
jgi:hypothetical protein